MIENVSTEISNISVEEIKKFNWGAFLLGPIWGMYNKSYLTFISYFLFFFKPGWVLNIILCIWYGIKGNEWALKNKTFENLEEFNKYQRKFAKAGIIFSIISIIGLLSTFFINYTGADSYWSILLQKALLELLIAIFSISVFTIFIWLSDKKNQIKIICTACIVLFFLGTNNIFNPTAKPACYELISQYYYNRNDLNKLIDYHNKGILAYSKNQQEYEFDWYIYAKSNSQLTILDIMYNNCFKTNDLQCITNETTSIIDYYDKNKLPKKEIYNIYLDRAYAYKKLKQNNLSENDVNSIKNIMFN